MLELQMKFKISDEQKNIDKYTEYHNISKLILQKIIFSKFLMIRLFYVKKFS